MTISQQIITIGICIGGTMLTRFLPFMLFSENHKTPAFIQYIGKYLPLPFLVCWLYIAFGMCRYSRELMVFLN